MMVVTDNVDKSDSENLFCINYAHWTCSSYISAVNYLAVLTVCL